MQQPEKNTRTQTMPRSRGTKSATGRIAGRIAGRAKAMAAGLSADEWRRIVRLLSRLPNDTEIGIFSAMWSEHCCYKSSRRLLARLPTKAPHVIHGPGENAGVIDIGEGLACVFKIESHNHPSFIEPYQGAATGVGGILRDIFTMGARPIALLNSLHFGDPTHPDTKRLVDGVTRGIGGYGNCIGIATVGGDCRFDPCYNGNNLVNAMAVGIVDKTRIFQSAPRTIGAPLLYFGAATGRDGIHGASMASQEFDDQAKEKRPTVQVGDPLSGKELLEACLELMDSGAVEAIQDMGAAGLTSSSFEMASSGNVGITLDLDRVPTREDNMRAYDLMLSESQERMLAVIHPQKQETAIRILQSRRIGHAVIGKIGTDHHVTGIKDGKTAFRLPVRALVDDAPAYRRRQSSAPAPSGPAPARPSREPVEDGDLGPILLKLIGSGDLSSRRWIWQQYDHGVGADTVVGPGENAAILRIRQSRRGLAVCLTGTARYCRADPYLGAVQAVCEGWRNLHCVGARPLAITNNLNYGNPENPRTMFQIAAGIDGIGKACRQLRLPVVSGNVSLYNETVGKAIAPTPIIGMVGIVDAIDDIPTLGRIQTVRKTRPDERISIVMIGDGPGHLGAGLYAKIIRRTNNHDEAMPPVHPATEKKHGKFVRTQIKNGQAIAVHDIGGGGLLIALTRMALAAQSGLAIHDDAVASSIIEGFFGEDQGRYLIAGTCPEAIIRSAEKHAIAGRVVAHIDPLADNHQDPQLTWRDKLAISLSRLRAAHEGWFPDMMGEAPIG